MKAVIVVAGLLSGLFTVTPAVRAQSPSSGNQAEAVQGLIKRLIPAYAGMFEISFIPKEKGKDVFELESKNNKIILRGSNGISVASALNFYLKNYAHCDISWNGSNLKIPVRMPQVWQKVRKVTSYPYRYYLNYCTFNYTMSWWDWDRWQWEIDWMALNGINMPLALTGQNSIWDKVYKSLGFSDKDLEGFYSGPAYFNWFWMGNLDGWGGPLPRSFMEKQEDLQKKILARERAFGMTPILPAFTGHVPPSFKDKFPEARLKKTNWSDFKDVYILDPDDPMFTAIGKKFIEEEKHTFGTDHFYSADTFNENTPPSNDSVYLNDISRKVYQSMAAADPAATWIMQGWMFSYSADFWQPTQIKALLNAVPDKKLIILDLFSENKPVWNRTEAYYGKPWIWCMLHNFGGNISMYGRMTHVANDPAEALHGSGSGNMVGIGLTPEAIEQNPVMYELMLEHVWADQPVDLDKWLSGYTLRRYGKRNENAIKAWEILKNTVYNGGISSGGPESIITGRPTFSKSTKWANTKKAYHPGDLLPAWDYMIAASSDLQNSEGFRYDLVDITRQVMANYADTLQQQFAAAYKRNDVIAFRKNSEQFLDVIDDMDRLLASQSDFLLGRWLNAAKKCGASAAEKKLYELNARDQITLWGDKNSALHDYACKQWAGLLSDFYKPRWEKFFAFVIPVMESKTNPDMKEFEAQIKEWEWSWVKDDKSFRDTPQGDPVMLAEQMYNKYGKQIKKGGQ